MYYEKDPAFFAEVIKKEEAPYEFKIHLFPDRKGADEFD